MSIIARNIDEENTKTPEFMRRSELVNFPSPLNSPTSIKHRESTVQIIDLDDLRRGLYKKKKYKEIEKKFSKEDILSQIRKLFVAKYHKE